MTNLLGRVRNKFIERLGRDFVLVANIFEIPSHRRDIWQQGMEGDGIWQYLEATERLSELPKALMEVKRADLSKLLHSSLVSLDSEKESDSLPLVAHGLSAEACDALRSQLPSTTGLQAAIVPSTISNPTLSAKEFITRYEQATLSVCSIGSDLKHIGTGFLVASDRIMTNYHVWYESQRLRSPIFATFQESSLNPQGPTKVEVLMQSPLAMSVAEQLDYAILTLGLEMGSERKPMELVPRVSKFRETLHVMGYPARSTSSGEVIVDPSPMLSSGVLFDHNAQSHRLAYSAETAPGSSGSPVFLGNFDLIGIHHHGQAQMNNHGICIRGVIQHLEAEGKEGLVRIRYPQSQVSEPIERLQSTVTSEDRVPPVAPPPSSTPTLFMTEFRERRIWIGYLNAYKSLHDTLHNLQGSIAEIEREAEECQGSGTQIRESTAGMLYDFVDRCKKVVDETETAKQPTIRRWIQQLEELVQRFLHSTGSQQIRALERIRNIPDQQLVSLNQELVACARRLDVEYLCEIIDGLTGLRPELKQSIQRFRSPCGELQKMIDVHDRCQSIQEDLRFIAASDCNTVDFAQMLDPLIAKLSELSRISFNDPAIIKTERAAATLRSSPSEMALDDLKDKFDNLFLRKDEALLKVIGQILLAQSTLSDALGEN
jgi:V8-like Glu-specific endopeptidase